MLKPRSMSTRKIIEDYQAHFQLKEGVLIITLKPYNLEHLLSAHYDQNNLPLKLQKTFNSPVELYQVISRSYRSNLKVTKDNDLMISVQQYGFRREYLLPLERTNINPEKEQSTTVGALQQRVAKMQATELESQKKIIDLKKQNSVLKQQNKQHESKIALLSSQIERLNFILSKKATDHSRMRKCSRSSDGDSQSSKEMVMALQEKILTLERGAADKTGSTTKSKIRQQQLLNEIDSLKQQLQDSRQQLFDIENELKVKDYQVDELTDLKQHQQMEIDILTQKLQKKESDIRLLHNEIKVLEVELVKANRGDNSNKDPAVYGM